MRKESRIENLNIWFLLLGLGLLALSPILFLCFFNHPLGTHEWDWISNWGGTTTHLNFWEEQFLWYSTVGGRYTSNAFLSTTCSWYSLATFRIVFVGNLFFLGLITSWLLKQVFIFLRPLQCAFLGMVVVVVYIASLTNVYESIYRFTVVAIYQLGLMGNLLAAGLLIRLREPSFALRRDHILLLLVIFLTAGTNEISLCLLYLSLLAYAGSKRIMKQPLPKIYWLWVGVLLLGSILAIGAPGNYARMAFMGVEPDLVKSIFLTMGASGYLWLKWMSNTLLIPLTIVAFPLFLRYRKQLQLSGLFQWPVLWLLALLTLVPLALLPLFFSAGMSTFPERIVDLLFFVFQCCYWGLVISIFLYFDARLPFKSPFPSLLVLGMSIYIVLRLFVGELSFNRDQKSAFNSYFDRIEVSANLGKAWLTILKGEPQIYSQAVMNQYTTIGNCDDEICLVSPPPVFPFGIYDPMYDRRSKDGDPFMSWFFNQKRQLVVYKK